MRKVGIVIHTGAEWQAEDFSMALTELEQLLNEQTMLNLIDSTSTAKTFDTLRKAILSNGKSLFYGRSNGDFVIRKSDGITDVVIFTDKKISTSELFYGLVGWGIDAHRIGFVYFEKYDALRNSLQKLDDEEYAKEAQVVLQ